MIPTTWASVESSNIDALKFDNQGGNLHVRFKSGAEYIYEEVPVELVEALYHAGSVGTFLRENIMGNYTHRRV